MENEMDQTTKESPKKVNWSEKYGKKGDKKKSKKGLIIGLIIAAVVLVLGIVIAKKVLGAVDAVKDSLGDGTIVNEYGKKDMSTYIDCTGTIESQDVEKVVSSLSLPIKEINVEVGDEVKAGDVLCTFNTDSIDDQIAALEAQASDAERLQAKQIEAASHTLSTTESAGKRTVKNASKNVTNTKEDFDKADKDYYEILDAYNQAVAEYDAIVATATNTDAQMADEKSPISKAAAAVAAAKAELDAADKDWYAKEDLYDAAVSAYDDAIASTNETNVGAQDSRDIAVISNSGYSQTATELAKLYKQKNDSVIISPIDGIVTSIDLTKDAPPVAVTNNPWVIITVADDSKFEVNVDIKEKDIFSVKEGMNVEISNSTLTNVSGSGKVTKVNKFATANAAVAAAAEATGAKTTVDNTFNAKITIDDAKDLLLGMKVKVRIATGEEMNTEAVPYTAIMNDIEGDYVYVATEAGGGMYMVERRNVEKGMSGDYYTEITGGDLEEGDLVIVYPSTVTLNTPITIKSDDEDSDTETTESKEDNEDKDEE